MDNKYIGLGSKGAKESAEIVGRVRRENYLAHTIREIEYAYLKLKSKNYHISTYISRVSNTSKAWFFDRGCSICLREEECEEMGDKTVRLTLAHELGHLIYNFDLLEKIDWLNTSKTSNEEEEFSWEFAYYLISEKSRAYASPSAYSRFHYGDQELKKAVRSLLNKKPKPVRDAVIKTLGLPNP